MTALATVKRGTTLSGSVTVLDREKFLSVRASKETPDEIPALIDPEGKAWENASAGVLANRQRQTEGHIKQTTSSMSCSNVATPTTIRLKIWVILVDQLVIFIGPGRFMPT